MITAKLEELLLKQKAQRFQITIGDGPVSIIPVPPGKTVIITDIEIIPTINAPGSSPELFDREANQILDQFIQIADVNVIGYSMTDIRNAVFLLIQKTMSRSCVQLIEQSAKINNTYTCAPDLLYGANPYLKLYVENANTDYYGIKSNFEIKTKNSKFEVYSIHADTVVFRWVYPIVVPDQTATPTLYNNIVNTQNAVFPASDLINTFFDNNMPQGIANSAVDILVSTLLRTPAAAIGAWVPVGIEQLSQSGNNTAVLANAFNYVRYPIGVGFTPAPGQDNNNLNAGTVDFGYNLPITTPNIQLFTSIMDYITMPKANIGYCVINENLTF
jgi:hypothetical protein